MTALLLEAPATRLSAPARPARPSIRRPATAARPCEGGGHATFRLVVPLTRPLPSRLYWTRRGLAVALALVALVLGLMASTLIASFLAISDAPPGRAPAPAAVAGLASEAG